MCWLDRIRIQTLAVIALIMVFTAATVVSPYLPHMILHAQQTGLGGVPGAVSEGRGAVSSVFGRTGAVTAQSGDYTCSQVTGCLSSAPVSSVFGRTGPVTAASGDYTAAQVTNAAATNISNTFTATQEIQTNSDPALELIQTGGSYVGLIDYGGQLGLVNNNAGNPVIMAMVNSGAARINEDAVSGFSSSTAPQTGAIDTGYYRVSAGVLGFTTSESSKNTNAVLEAAAFQAGGTVFTVSGCGTPTATGGATYGTFAAGSGTCNPVITPGKTATNGWVCVLQDETTSGASFRQSAHSTTTATLTGTNVASGDTIDVACGAF